VSHTALSRIFERHYPDGPAALVRFRSQISKVNFDFDLEISMCEHQFPAQVGIQRGMPSMIYYYLPSTGFGSVSKPPVSPDDPTHLRSSDGIGLNMGCPIRLSRALEVVFSLRPEDQVEPLSLLRARTSHLASVEELLWLTLWQDRKEVTRGGEPVPPEGRAHAKKVDWFFFSCDIPIYLEAKFRPTDWMRFSDRSARQTPESLFADIGSKSLEKDQRSGSALRPSLVTLNLTRPFSP